MFIRYLSITKVICMIYNQEVQSSVIPACLFHCAFRGNLDETRRLCIMIYQKLSMNYRSLNYAFVINHGFDDDHVLPCFRVQGLHPIQIPSTH